MSEPPAVATGSGSLLDSKTKPRGKNTANRAEMNFGALPDPVATAHGSGTPSKRPGLEKSADKTPDTELPENIAHLVDQFLVFEIFGLDFGQLFQQLALFTSQAGGRHYRN